MLPKGKTIHTFREAAIGPGGLALIGADTPRMSIMSKINHHPCYRSGPGAMRLGHGLCIHDKGGPLFVETTPESRTYPELEKEATDSG